MSKPIVYLPKASAIRSSKMFQFMTQIQTKHPQVVDWATLHAWSIECPSQFWRACASFCDFKWHVTPQQDLRKLSHPPFGRFFEDGTCNYAEMCLQGCDEAVVVIEANEQDEICQHTRGEIKQYVANAVAQLKAMHIGPHDVVAGILSNRVEAIVLHLATAALGAIWTTCGVEFGFAAFMARLSQVDPKLICFSGAYIHKGKTFDMLPKIRALKENMSSTCRWLCVNPTDDASCDGFAVWQKEASQTTLNTLTFPSFPFNHPLVIAFSSGTTGQPKCMVHGAGNVLLQQMKEHQLHLNMHANDRLMYLTQCGWMMWNWQLAAMASGLTICLYDGHPFHPTPTHILKISSALGVTHLGVSAGYLQALEQINPPMHVSWLKTTKMILSTGAPLFDSSYTFVYKHWPHLRLESITGGTDILSCFALGNPLLPIRSGCITAIGLGMDVRVSDIQGHTLMDQEGELTCHNVCPSMPTHFLNDATHQIYRTSYFKNHDQVWWHGDCAEMCTGGGIVMRGRLDATLNPNGVRMGTAELYGALGSLPFIASCAAIMVKQTMMVLFVQTRAQQHLTQAHKDEIIAQLRTQCSPRHIPDAILQAPALPHTHTGKLMETLIRDCCNGVAIKHMDAVANPESLIFFQNNLDFDRHRT